MVEGSSPLLRVLVRWGIALTHFSRCEGRMSRIRTDPNVTGPVTAQRIDPDAHTDTRNTGPGQLSGATVRLPAAYVAAHVDLGTRSPHTALHSHDVERLGDVRRPCLQVEAGPSSITIPSGCAT